MPSRRPIAPGRLRPIAAATSRLPHLAVFRKSQRLVAGQPDRVREIAPDRAIEAVKREATLSHIAVYGVNGSYARGISSDDGLA